MPDAIFIKVAFEFCETRNGLDVIVRNVMPSDTGRIQLFIQFPLHIQGVPFKMQREIYLSWIIQFLATIF